MSQAEDLVRARRALKAMDALLGAADELADLGVLVLPDGLLEPARRTRDQVASALQLVERSARTQAAHRRN